MADDIDIEVWISGALWCPNPDSDREMQLHFKLIREGDKLVIVAPKKRILGTLPQREFHRLKHLHYAGADFDICILDSMPKERMFLVSMFIGSEEIDDLSSKVNESKKRDRESRKKIQDEIKSKIIAKAKKKAEKKIVRKERYSKILGQVWRFIQSIGRITARSCVGLISKSRKGWAKLVVWTNRESN
jgi:hypothetical protein